MRRSVLALAVACFSALASSVPAPIPTSQDTIQGIELAAGQKVGIYRVGATFAATATGTSPAP